MASSYSTDLKLELMVTGENAGTWGDNTNNNLNLIQQAIAGYEAIALTDGGTVTLAMTDKTISNARNMILKFTGTLTTASTVTIPDSIEKFYIIDLSAVVGVTNLTIKTASGSGFTAGEAKIVAAYSDGTDLNEIALDTLGGTIGTAQIADNAITAAKISNNAVTADKILASTITQAKLATDSVGANQLISTGVTAGSYTTANITVDADGRITAASSGVSGPTIYGVKQWSVGPATGSFATGSNTSEVYVWLYSASGGGGGTHYYNPPSQGGNGGLGKFGIFTIPVSASTQVPFSLGSGGNGGPGTPMAMTATSGNASQATSIDGQTYINAATGGNAATYAMAAGNPGTASNYAIPATIDVTPTINPLTQIYQNYSLPNLGGTAQIPGDPDGSWFGLTAQGALSPSEYPFHGQGGKNYPAPYGQPYTTYSEYVGDGLPGGASNIVIFDKL